MAPEPSPEVQTPVEPQPEPEPQPQPEEPPRDERGRFASREAEPALATPTTGPQAKPPDAPTEPPKDDSGQVPSWRLREVREAREAAEKRASENERIAAHAHQQMQAMQRRLQELEQPKTAPDIFENPTGFLQHGVREAVSPVQAEIAQMREYFSRRDAERTHGPQKVQEAYNTLGQAMSAGDPEAASIYRQAMSSMDPYGAIMGWHQKRSVFGQIGGDPDAWFEKRLQERLTGDKEFQAKVLESIRGKAPATGQDGKPAIEIPPSINRLTGSGASQNEPSQEGDMSERALFNYAMADGKRRR